MNGQLKMFLRRKDPWVDLNLGPRGRSRYTFPPLSIDLKQLSTRVAVVDKRTPECKCWLTANHSGHTSPFQVFPLQREISAFLAILPSLLRPQVSCRSVHDSDCDAPSRLYYSHLNDWPSSKYGHESLVRQTSCNSPGIKSTQQLKEWHFWGGCHGRESRHNPYLRQIKAKHLKSTSVLYLHCMERWEQWRGKSWGRTAFVSGGGGPRLNFAWFPAARWPLSRSGKA